MIPVRVLAALTSAWIVAVSAVDARSVELVRSYSVAGNFVDDGGHIARDLSGFACMPQPARRCLAINDENRSAQFATLEDGRITPESPLIQLIGETPAATTLGKEPDVETCPGKTEFKDLDGEAVAYAAPYFYVVGAHGCSRKKGAFRPSSFVLARIHVDSQGRPVDARGRQLTEATAGNAVETTYRISDFLQRPSAVSPFFGKGLDEASNGLNIEGLTVFGDKLFMGLRAPSLEGQAYIVGASLADLFAAGHTPASTEPEVIAVPLGPKTAKIGIRDLAPYKDRLLILAGPSQEQGDVPYGLFVVEPRAGSRPTSVGTIPDVIEEGKRMSAESVTILDARSDTLRILIMFDGPQNGEPREYRVSLRRLEVERATMQRPRRLHSAEVRRAAIRPTRAAITTAR